MSPSGKSGVITTASDFYFVEDKPAARIGDTVTYSDGSTTVIAEGDPGLDVIGRGVARLGYRLADGGKIVEGATKVFSDDASPGRGTAAERTLVSARARAQGLTPIDCPARVARAYAAADAAPAEPKPAAVAPAPARQAAIDRDLPHGSRWDTHPVAGEPAPGPT